MEQPFALILASASPRRRELLSRMGYAFEICAPDVDEHVEGRAEDIVKTLAVRKARAAASHYARGVIIASDTLVSLDGRPLGKPADENEAHAMLRALSGRAHEVFTGVCLHDAATGREMVEEVKTAVRFRELTDEEIWDYIRTGEPMDKAGAYGIQGGAGAFVEGLDGSFENVMGFPVDDVERMLRAFTGEG
ncbi:MAG TPA: septum formation protein Maf [Candidatus Pullichristensenella excrementipullorum]|nr:septum formation protein Maf [Candidatus Pullichristensenella excrementipullorum]